MILTEPNLTNLLKSIWLFLCDGGCCVVELRLLLLERKANSLHSELPCAIRIIVTKVTVPLSYTCIYFESNIQCNTLISYVHTM